MKKIIITMGLLSVLGCDKHRKIYLNDEKFNVVEKQMKISSEQASEIYKKSFDNNFDVKESPYQKELFYEIIYIESGFYYIGFASKNDKRDMKTAPIYFLAQINPETGEISVVK